MWLNTSIHSTICTCTCTTHEHHDLGLTQEKISNITDILFEIDVQSTELQDRTDSLAERLENIRIDVDSLLSACNSSEIDCSLIPDPNQLNVAADFDEVPHVHSLTTLSCMHRYTLWQSHVDIKYSFVACFEYYSVACFIMLLHSKHITAKKCVVVWPLHLGCRWAEPDVSMHVRFWLHSAW